MKKTEPKTKPAKQTSGSGEPYAFCPLPQAGKKQEWTKGVCPNCGYAKADVDPDGILWCPACGYSKKGCYT